MMKKYKYLLLFIIGLSTVSCSDLEENPQGLLAPESYYTDMDKVQNAVNGAYGHMLHRWFMSRATSLTLMVRSDMVIANTPNQGRVDNDNFAVAADNYLMAQIWPKIYQIIGSANAAIRAAELVDAPESEKNPIIAQAYFARAFSYFHLVRMFGEIPYLDETSTDIEAVSTMSKSSVADVYAKIISDLEWAKANLPNTQTARSIPAKSAASAYLASVYLTMGEFQKAYDEAKDCIDNEGAYQLGLEPDFQDVFDASKTDASKEPIFVLDFIGVSNGDQGRDYMSAFTGIRNDNQYGHGGGWSVLVPNVDVFNSWDSNDYRRAVSFDNKGLFSTGVDTYHNFLNYHGSSYNAPHIAKFTRKSGPTNQGNGRLSNNNYLMMRYAEVLLIAAEAANEIGDPDGNAHSLANRVKARARAGGITNGNVASVSPADVSGLSQDAFRTMILNERKWELAFEFKRWYDIARRKLGNEAFGASGHEGIKSTFDPNKDYLLPLPADELVRNSNLMPNNPGY